VLRPAVLYSYRDTVFKTRRRKTHCNPDICRGWEISHLFYLFSLHAPFI